MVLITNLYNLLVWYSCAADVCFGYVGRLQSGTVEGPDCTEAQNSDGLLKIVFRRRTMLSDEQAMVFKDKSLKDLGLDFRRTRYIVYGIAANATSPDTRQLPFY